MQKNVKKKADADKKNTKKKKKKDDDDDDDDDDGSSEIVGDPEGEDYVGDPDEDEEEDEDDEEAGGSDYSMTKKKKKKTTKKVKPRAKPKGKAAPKGRVEMKSLDFYFYFFLMWHYFGFLKSENGFLFKFLTDCRKFELFFADDYGIFCEILDLILSWRDCVTKWIIFSKDFLLLLLLQLFVTALMVFTIVY